jgi:hypothetical protein
MRSSVAAKGRDVKHAAPQRAMRPAPCSRAVWTTRLTRRVEAGQQEENILKQKPLSGSYFVLFGIRGLHYC